MFSSSERGGLFLLIVYFIGARLVKLVNENEINITCYHHRADEGTADYQDYNEHEYLKRGMMGFTPRFSNSDDILNLF